MRCAHLNIETNVLCICSGRKAISSAKRDASVSPTDEMRGAMSTSECVCFANVHTFLCSLADSCGISSHILYIYTQTSELLYKM